MDSKKSRKKCMELPEDCWILIFNLLGHYRHFELISLVSRRFLSITNHLRRSLTITKQVTPFLPNLLSRFPNIDEINIRKFYGNRNELLGQISASNIVLRSISLPNYSFLPIEGLRYLGSKMQSSLRILNCSGMLALKDDDLVTIANTFLFLEELDISCVSSRSREDCFSDAGILQMSLHLKELRKINLSGNQFITDESIISLSSNCLFLRELVIHPCNFTTKGIGKALRDCHHLNYISAKVRHTDEYFSKSFAYATNLYELDISFRNISLFMADKFLSDLAEANIPLKKLKTSGVFATYKGISNLLHKYRSLVYLNVQWLNFLTDQNVAEISKFLNNITYINLSRCYKLTSSSFFTIIRSCPFVCNIRMRDTNVGGIEEFETTDFAVNHRVKKLKFSGGNYEMCDEFLEKIAFTCPNLQNLHLSGSRCITVEGINTVLRNCHEIRKLKISWCKSISKFNINIALPNLEDLRAKGLDLDDKSLEIIGERCTGLLCLDLSFCPNVSGNGVMEVAKKCRKLRRINLRGCENIDSDTIFSLVSLGSSLRKITPPHAMTLSESEKKLFLPHTCQLDYGFY